MEKNNNSHPLDILLNKDKDEHNLNDSFDSTKAQQGEEECVVHYKYNIPGYCNYCGNIIKGEFSDHTDDYGGIFCSSECLKEQNMLNSIAHNQDHNH